MAATEVNTPEPALTNGASKPPPGVIVPAKGMRESIEKTASYIVRQGERGPAFEARVREKQAGNPKFSFLQPGDPYNAYYVWYIQEVEAGRASATGQDDQPKAIEKPKGPPPPAEFHFSARMPNISAQDLEIIKLTAKYTAKNGRQWMTALSQREAGNFQFDFLRPQHSFYQFFTRLVDQYTELITGEREKERITEVKHNVQDRFHVLDRAKLRAEYVRFEQTQKQKQEEKVEKEKLEYAQIDWHDFVVVGTIDFVEADDHAELPPPTSLGDLQSRSLEQKAAQSINPNMRIEEAMPGDDTYYVAGQQPVQMPSAHAGWQSQSDAMGYQMQPHQPQEDEEARLIRERQEEREKAQQAQAAAKGAAGPMRIRNDYVPRAQAKKQNAGMALCPNCKMQVPFDELEQHMRIELLDPNWKEQRARAESRYATTNLSTVDVANNLKRLASQRDDVFDGVTGMPLSEEEQARRKKAAMNYDGQPDAKDAVRMQQMQSLNVEEQLRQIKQRYAA